MEDVMASTSNTVPQAPKSPEAGERAARPAAGSGRMVRQFRQILLWPLQLIPPPQGTQARDGDFLAAIANGADPRWTEINDEFPDDPGSLQEHTYREFVSFLPHVQRFLYGARASRSAGSGSCESPVRVFSRPDIAKMRITPIAGTSPLLFNVARVELRFFCDVDVVILAVEIEARDLALEHAQEVMYRFGRAYPSGWTDTGQAWHCPERVEWLDREGRVLATSDYEHRERFLTSVCRHQVPTIASHWTFLLAPLTMCLGDATGPLRYRLVEHNWIPIMAYLAVDDPASLTENDHARLGLVLPPGDPASAPYAATFLRDFNERYCYDRFHDPLRTDDWIDTRIMCFGHAFVMVGDARQPVVTDLERGLLAQFRNSFFLLGLIAHLHRAALLMLSDRLARTIGQLDTERPQSIENFQSDIRRTLEIFLRFSHRYWFYEVSNQAVARDLFRLWSDHLATARLYGDVREELRDMSEYLDSDMLRRSSATIVRLTVVAILSLIGTATTGFLGMNLLDATEAPFVTKVAYFALVAALAIALTVYTIVKASRLAEFLDVLADGRLYWRRKLKAFFEVWEKR
jgi:hypothetical protein